MTTRLVSRLHDADIDESLLRETRRRLYDDIRDVNRSIRTLRAMEYNDEINAARRTQTVENLMQRRNALTARLIRIRIKHAELEYLRDLNK